MSAAIASAPRRIRILPHEIISRIAAGEVVERPASVLKELAENALDAKAARIDVEIAAGGMSLVRVCDDGLGMNREDLELSVQQHATSKIDGESDLCAIASLGFRGEALPSIAAVSRFSLTSRCREERSESAWCLQSAGGQPEKPAARPAAGPFGTSAEVRELFFNLPARKKFLKGQAAEAAACTDTLLRLALTSPFTGFSLRQEGHEVFSVAPETKTDGPGPYFSRARQLLGRHNAAGLIEICCAAGLAGYRLYGLISPPAVTRPNRSHIYLNVNGRAVKDRLLVTALIESYRHLLVPKRFPLCVLFLEVPAGDVDVNVHPSKAEVRFRQSGAIFSLLHHAVREGLGVLAQTLAPRADSAPTVPAAPQNVPLGAPKASNGQRTFDLSIPSTSGVDADRVADRSAQYAAPVAPAPALQAVPPDAGKRSAKAPSPFRVLGQAGGSYIVIEDDCGVKLIDQHALHERVLFETLIARAENSSRGDSQLLLVPETLELTALQLSVFIQDQEAQAVLEHLGFKTELFGPRAIAVHAVPAILKGNAASLVRDVLDAIADAGDSVSAGLSKNGPLSRAWYREKAAYILSCKGAIKAGERLSIEQMTALMNEFKARVKGDSFTCPHGRPLALELSWAQIQRSVGRG